MLGRLQTNIRHHARFYMSALIGIGIWFATSGINDGEFRLALAGDGLFGAYLILMALFIPTLTPDRLRHRADVEDEGAFLIVLMTLAAIALSLGAIFVALNKSSGPSMSSLAVSIASVPLGWSTLHIVSALHYAHIYYARDDTSGKVPGDAGGLDFPGTGEPGIWDFLYYSFVIGMTAQVSDVQVKTTHLRKLTLVHGIVSFFYNTVLLALAVNVVVSLAH